MGSTTTTPTAEELQSLLAMYSRATERLQVSHDRLMSEVSLLSAELEHKNKLLARKTRLEVLGEMAAGVAHEIRNPLGGILLYSGLLERDLADQEGPLRLVRAIRSGVSSLDAIVDDLLSFTRGFEPTLRPCTLEAVAEDALRAAVGDLARTDVWVVRDFAEGGTPLEADAELLRRATLNIVLNAIQAMGKAGTLTVRTRREGVGAHLEVCDTGPGIAPEMRDRLFEPYATGKQGGTGLGLAIVEKIVESHGGEVRAHNAAEGGACFRMMLPASAAAPEATEREEATAS
jgi:signal transduction histidine kinase